MIGTVGGFFFIPRDHLIFSRGVVTDTTPPTFFLNYIFISLFCILLVSLVIGMIGAFIFILLQVIFLVDFAHSWAEAWSVKKIGYIEIICVYVAVRTVVSLVG